MTSQTHADHAKVWDYLRHNKKFPNVWCPGCGIGIVLHAIIRAVDRMELAKNDVAMVTGIGCTGRMSAYVDFHTLHTTHGRALAFATGLKMARPSMHVIVVMGDGDALAIGGNHFIHAARRNIDLTAIVVNNHTYGMTGAQASPTTPPDMMGTTTPYGNVEPPFPIDELAKAAGAVFVARSTVYHAVELDRLIEKALQKRGFSLVEAVSYCHTGYGKLNRLGSAADMMRSLKDNSMTLEAAARLTPEERQGKLLRGVVVDRDLPEYTDLYSGVIRRAQEARRQGLGVG